MTSSGYRRVAVVGSAQTQLRRAWSHRQHVDLIAEAVNQALKGTGIDIDDVAFIIDSGSDILDGRSISNCGFLGAMGANGKEESRVEDDGLWAALYGVSKIASGSADVGLVLAYSKPSESSLPAYYASQTEPFFQRPVGFDHLAACGLQAQRYLADSGLDAGRLSDVVAHAWGNATDNPRVDAEAVPTPDEIGRSPVRAAPLRELELSRPVDGAVAIVITAEDIARKATESPVWVTGMGTAMDQHTFAMREPGALAACEAAARAAYRRAGLASPSGVSLVETGGSSAVGELMVLEALGLAEKGRGIDLYDADGGPTVNPSGGSLPADPVMATGLVRMSEAALRLSGQVTDVPNASSAIVHGQSGIGMQNHAVFVLEI